MQDIFRRVLDLRSMSGSEAAQSPARWKLDNKSGQDLPIALPHGFHAPGLCRIVVGPLSGGVSHDEHLWRMTIPK
jgi:hypothetical protein